MQTLHSFEEWIYKQIEVYSEWRDLFFGIEIRENLSFYFKKTNWTIWIWSSGNWFSLLWIYIEEICRCIKKNSKFVIKQLVSWGKRFVRWTNRSNNCINTMIFSRFYLKFDFISLENQAIIESINMIIE